MMDDIDRIMEVMDAAFDPRWGEAWTHRQVSDSLAFPHTHYRLIGPDGEPATGRAAGFTLVRAMADEEELLLVAVAPAHRGAGLGRRLLGRVLADARGREASRVFLEMRANNPAERFYRLSGFEPIGRRPAYYHTPGGETIDAITFACDLKQALPAATGISR
ncbi:GNAT family N-acetyltransferase [Altererythrobacter aerius]|uniref:GNAT family N-acetyltransferase n=1 Tax=Tsuneonella aeria TaxID=1837929 RepID=A0A6I4TAG0_9SPHN|nr:GNAT family N-acetyltransferase [Tsuneonella aeria]MXO73657.1 GNAT family N-acetyltransferase [Tsuneonella aeria]